MFYTSMGYMFVSLAAIFALGLVPSLAPRIYPASPNVSRRLIAPVVFAMLATACFTGIALQALVLTVVLGLPCIITNRWHERKFKRVG